MKHQYEVGSDKNDSETTMTSTSTVAGCAPEVSKFRRYLPQILASTVKNFLLLDTGLSVAIPTIVIPALKGLNNENNPDEILRLTPVQASWLGSILFICQPLGSIFSGWICEPLGRKRAMVLVNIPHIIAWLLLFYSTTLWEIFVAYALLGLGVGLMEAPIITYVGEICQPSIRGILVALSGLAATTGLSIVYTLSNLMPWRQVALCCLSVPVSTMVAVCFIPETPLWLLSKNRSNEALQSLQWLRGWVTPQAVEDEFKKLVRYNDFSNACHACVKAERKCTHPRPTIHQKLKELLRKRTIKPFVIVMLGFFIAQFSGKLAMRPYIVQVIKAYGSPISPNKATVILGVAGIIATLISVCMVKVIGKRKLFLTALTIECGVCFALAIYGFMYLPPGFLRSFDENYPYELVDNQSYIPLILFTLMYLCTGAGLSNVPWMLLSELFPFKARGYATGISAACNYLVAFTATKTFFNIEMVFSLPGAAAFYGSICVFGFISMYMILPETENRTLEDIELHFSDNKRKLTDRKIQKTNKINKNIETGVAKDVATIENTKVKLDGVGPIVYVNEVNKPVNSLPNGLYNENLLGIASSGVSEHYNPTFSNEK